MRRVILGFMVSISMTYIPVTLQAWGIVHDPLSYSQMLTSYAQLVRQYGLLKQQFGQLKTLADAVHGSYGFGGFLNSAQNLSDRQWSPDDWQQALQRMSGGNAERYQELVNDYHSNHVILSSREYQKGVSKNHAAIYRQDVQVNRAATATATYEFNSINKHLDTIHQLSAQIDHAENSKAAMDLNSRLLTEVAYIQTQSLKMQVLLNQQMAQVNADTIADKTQRAQFERITSNK